MRTTGRIGLTALLLSGVLVAGTGVQAAAQAQPDGRVSSALAAAIADFDAGRYVEARVGLMAAIALGAAGCGALPLAVAHRPPARR